MRHVKTKNHPSGFSLIEVLFAVLLLSVVLFGVIRLEVSQFRLTETQQNEVEAYSLAHQNIEKILALGKKMVEEQNMCGNGDCRCKISEGNLNCSEDAQEINGIFTHYFLLNHQNLIEAWQAMSLVEWEDATGEHQVKVKRILY